MVVGVVIAREQCVVMGVLVMEAVADNVVHAGVRVDNTEREVEDEEEGDTVEAVDVGMVIDRVSCPEDAEKGKRNGRTVKSTGFLGFFWC
ncbi:hypothetical protein NDU88_005007 [Pleurodeles waltl]|uniref:Uncharacterized protein n=1 Tax=Pleurodeles waltl TaxID=8319 RepID=A0AAV7RL36_PLEWA|nr:hypothetical protein NDU88_005007 [Pleurodeles waltl]